ncbi:MAG: sigma-70 family RNA polymerase sigma factor [candidate division Zixibacteria bacterium]|nr:sigma-70 family RNA polymerase sigma factor [candidate division Zixibacteria bacterium]
MIFVFFLNRFCYYAVQMDEKELVKKAQQGDFDAFNTLIENYKTRIYNLALKMSGDRHDAEDILQDTFLKAVDNIDKFRGESSFGTWLYAIAVNQVRGQYASRKKAELKPIEDYLPAGHGSAEDKAVLFDWGDPHDILETREIQEIIDQTLSDMPNKYSLPFILRYYEDMPVKEVAKTMNLTLAAAKSRILRARLALREKLSEIFREKTNEQV